MTKRYCDRCNREMDDNYYELGLLYVKKIAGKGSELWEICKTCAKDVKKFIEIS